MVWRRRWRGSMPLCRSSVVWQAGLLVVYWVISWCGAIMVPQHGFAGLQDRLVKVLELSIGAGGTTFSDFRDLTGTNGNYGGQAWVYRRGGEPCRQCGTILRRDTLGGRSSHWCPSCQR